jgi:hypothetical protein
LPTRKLSQLAIGINDDETPWEGGHMLRRTLSYCSIAIFAFLVACGGSEQINQAASGQTIQIGGDTADSSCRVVLRSVVPTNDGKCPEGVVGDVRCLWVGEMEIAADYPASVAAVFMSTDVSNGRWDTIEAIASAAPATAGFKRFTFFITDSAVLANTGGNVPTNLELIPHASVPFAGRLFDHNFNEHEFANYVIDMANPSFVQAAAICPVPNVTVTPTYKLDYPSFDESIVKGPIIAGGKVKIDYDARRLRDVQSCMGSKGPSSATTIMAAYTFDDDWNNVKAVEVERYLETYSPVCQGPAPCVTVNKTVPEVDVPAGAMTMRMWFYCVPGYSSASPSHWKYDSNYGQDYIIHLANSPRKVDWISDAEVYYSRSGMTAPAPEPITYSGFSNLDPTLQFRVYVKGLTDQPAVDQYKLKAYVVTDLVSCKPGQLEKVELPLVQTHAGPYAQDALFRWGYQAAALRCPKGTYQYGFMVTADGGVTNELVVNGVGFQLYNRFVIQ